MRRCGGLSGGRRAGRTRAQIIDRMAAVLEAQMAAGVFLSRHLRAGAVDVRSRGLTTSQRAAVRACVRKDPAVRLLPEGRPPHFHLDFR